MSTQLGVSINAANLRTDSIKFADREGEGVKKSRNYVDVIQGSPLKVQQNCAVHQTTIWCNSHYLFQVRLRSHFRGKNTFSVIGNLWCRIAKTSFSVSAPAVQIRGSDCTSEKRLCIALCWILYEEIVLRIMYLHAINMLSTASRCIYNHSIKYI